MKQSFRVLALLLGLAGAAAAQPSPVTIYNTMPAMNAILGAANMDADPADEIVILDSAGERLQIVDSATGAIDFDSAGWGWYRIYPPGYSHQDAFNTAYGPNHGYHVFCDRDNDGVMEAMVLVSTINNYQQELAIISLNGGGASAIPAATATGASLGEARPNPFNPATSIAFSLDAAGVARVTVYDLAGRLVRTLVDEPRPAGPQTVVWDGRDDEGRAVASGTYFYQLETEGRSEARKAMLLK